MIAISQRMKSLSDFLLCSLFHRFASLHLAHESAIEQCRQSVTVFEGVRVCLGFERFASLHLAV